MSTPIIEYIAANIAATIAAITTGNGFNYTLNAVRASRIMFLTTPWEDLDVVITMADEKEREGALGDFPVETIIQKFNLQAIAIDSDTETDSSETKQNKIAADIIKKTQEDCQRGTYAIDTFTESAGEPFDIQERLSGINIIISVKYRVKTNDPFTQA